MLSMRTLRKKLKFVRSCCNMAIKIIKEGKKEVDIYKVTCDRCQCVFECDERDAKIDLSIIGRKCNMLEIKCPNCKEMLSFVNKPIRKELL